MKKLMLAAIFAVVAGSVVAQQVSVGRNVLGSGVPGAMGSEQTTVWDATNNIFHSPQYLPGYPTAATLWPRVIDVKCKKVDGNLNCDGYNWMPEYGRGEYLMIHPVIVNEPAITGITIINNPVKEVPVIVIKEVPTKPKGQ
jgi:hypothetical protein